MRNGAAILGLVICVLVLPGFRQDPSAYLVKIVVNDLATTPCLEVMEIWSDKTTVVRCIGPGERPNKKCGPSVHCTSNTVHCSMLGGPGGPGGATCEYCTTGTANNSFCWPVTEAVCTTVPGEDYTCGTRMQATCVLPPGGGNATCTGGTPVNLGTCNLEACT